MSVAKNEVLTIGNGNLKNQTRSTRIFSSSIAIDTFSSVVTYITESAVEYNGKIYKSRQNSNLNNQPDTSPAFWEMIIPDAHDGDLCVQVNGNASDLSQRVGGVWLSLSNKPKTITLNNNQASPALAFQYPAVNFPTAMLEISTRRGLGASRKVTRDVRILNDTGNLQYSEEITAIGADPGVILTYQVSGGMVQVLYTSTNDNPSVFLDYVLRGY